MARVDKIFESRWLSNMGPFVQEFEARLKEITGAKHCIPMCNGTIALEVAVRALNLTGEVIVPSFTFVATVHALRWHGLDPVFCDVNPNTHNLDPQRVESLITPRTSGIAAVHLWGRSCEVCALQDIAHRHDLKLIFDAAHAFGCSCDGQMIDNFGDVEVFSFHATKFVNSFEGGAIATNDDELAERIRLMKNFGFAGYDNVESLGTNGKMSEVSGAMGLTSLESMDEIVAANRRNYMTYRQGLGGVPGLRLIEYDDEERCNYQYIILEVDESVTGLSRDDLVNVLQAENVLARRYFYPGCHRMEPYLTEQPNVGDRLSHTETLSESVLALPTGTSVAETSIRAICNLIRRALANPTPVKEQLQ